MVDARVLIIPDVHGREFWREPVIKTLKANEKNGYKTKIVFLGDYLDPYGYEGIDGETAFNNFKDIVQLKKDHMDEIILLIGNHDASYPGPAGVCQCRHMHEFHHEARMLFLDNIDCFDVAYQIPTNTIEGVDFLFSHAGVTNGWLQSYPYLFGTYDVKQMDTMLNGLFHDAMDEKDRTSDDGLFMKFWNAMGAVGHSRGGWSRYGSMIWADMQEHMYDNESPDNKIQIFGHTQLSKVPFRCDSEENKNNGWYNLDVREAFYLDKYDNVRHYNDDKAVEVTKIDDLINDGV